MNLIKTDPQLLNFWEMSSFSVFLSFVFVIFWTPGHHVKQQQNIQIETDTWKNKLFTKIFTQYFEQQSQKKLILSAQ